MNARELLDHFDLNGFTSPWRETILSALSLLAAAEANDGTTPITDALRDSPHESFSFTTRDERLLALSGRFERERQGLAAKVGRLTEDAERYRFLRDAEYPEPLLLMLREPGIHRNFVDAAIDAERAK